MKDNFSLNSDKYAKFRPTYPAQLFEHLMELVPEKNTAWDCGTGNGQMAAELAKYFSVVEATDISPQQIAQAVKKKNINYAVQKAETTNFPRNHFDFISVAQAIHWFDLEEFYHEVQRTLKPHGLLAVIGYGLFRSNNKTNNIVQYLYKDLLGAYWDEERKYLDEMYETLPFPFKELEVPKQELKVKWKFDRLIGYLKTWSAANHYEKAKGINPVDLITSDLKNSFGNENYVVFPILTRLGKLI